MIQAGELRAIPVLLLTSACKKGLYVARVVTSGTPPLKSTLELLTQNQKEEEYLRIMTIFQITSIQNNLV